MTDQPTLQESTAAPKRVLVIVAHPDDIEFGAAGSIARWTDAGAEIVYCIITDGAAGSNDPATDVKELARRRQTEQCSAAETVGVREVRFLGYADGTLQPTLDLRRDLTRMIREFKPDRVICQDPTTVFMESDYINHPDHRAAGEAAIYSVFPSAETRPIFPELLAEGREPHHVTELYLTLTTQPNTFVDISETIDRKIKALLCHESQVGEKEGLMVREWNAETGKLVERAFAERFRVMRFDDGNRSLKSPGDGQADQES